MFHITRQEMWLIDASGPGGIPVIGGRMTLYGTADEWTFDVAPPARATFGSGTVTLSECSSGCSVIGTARVTAFGTATNYFHYSDRVSAGSAPGNSFDQVNGWDDSIVGQISIDGAVVASGLTGWIQDVKLQRVNVEH